MSKGTICQNLQIVNVIKDVWLKSIERLAIYRTEVLIVMHILKLEIMLKVAINVQSLIVL